MAIYDFYHGLDCLTFSRPRKETTSLTSEQLNYLRKIRRGIYQKLLQDNLSLVSETDVNNFRGCLELEGISFYSIINEISLSPQTVIPTNIENIGLVRENSYKLCTSDKLEGIFMEDRVKEELAKIITKNWIVIGAEYCRPKKEFIVKITNPCRVSIPIIIAS